MTHPKVLELWEMLEAKKGNTASQLACLDNWLENTKGWAFYNEDFGETFKFFKSNSSTCCEAAQKFSEKLSQIYCEHIAAACKWVDNSSTVLSVVQKLSKACKDPQNKRVVLHRLAGSPNFCSSTSIKVASGYFGDELDIDVCRSIVKEYGDKVRDQQMAAEQAETDAEIDAEMARQSEAWFKKAKSAGGRPIYLRFWEKYQKCRMEGGAFTDKDPMFSNATAQFPFFKMGGKGAAPQFLAGISFLKKFTEPKFEQRQGILKAGILFYFKNTSAKGCIPVHRPADFGEIVALPEGEGYAFTVMTKLPRRIPEDLGCTWQLGGKTREDAEKLLKALQDAQAA